MNHNSHTDQRPAVLSKQNWLCQSLAVAVTLVFCLAGSAWALDPAKTIFQFNCRNWTRQNGLPADKISGVAQSKDGYLWLGTQDGLVRFDGVEFKSVPIDLPSAQGQDVWRLTAAPDGTLRFCINNGGFGGYDGRKFFTVEEAHWSQPGAFEIMAASDGATWVSAASGLGRWSPANPAQTFYLSFSNVDQVLSFCEGPGGRMWLGTAENGLQYWQDGKIVSIPDALQAKKNISALALEGTNRLWVGTSAGLRCYENGKFTEATNFSWNVTALLLDRNGVLWMGTAGGGLARRENGNFVFFGKADGLGSDFVTSLFEDAEGSLWIGTRDGLSQLSDLKFPIFSSKEGIVDGSCHSVAADKKEGLWIATDNGLAYMDGKGATNFVGAALPGSAYIKLCFVAHNGDVYVEDGEKNIDVFSAGRLVSRLTNSAWISAFGEDAQSVIVGRGTGHGLFRLQNGRFTDYEYRDPAPDYYWINNLRCARDGAIWVASKSGLYRLQAGAVQRWSSAEGLSGDNALWVFEDPDGSIWAGLATGVVRIKNGQFKNIKVENGLADSWVYAIVPDDCGYFWFCSSRGIFRASRQNLNDFADGKAPRVACELFNGLEAVKSAGRTDQENSGCKTADGRIWFPSPWGVIRIDPAHVPTNRVAPPVHIDRVQANGHEFSPAESIIVPPGPGQLEVQFTALSFIAPEKIPFRYRLDGFDDDWVSSEGRHQAFYTNLKPGRYTFHVIAANADGVWNETGDAVQI